MSIVKMKRLRVIGLQEEREVLLDQLLRLGCVEISEPEDKMTNPQWTALVKREASSLSTVKSEASVLTAALAALKKYASAKDGLFQKRSDISEEAFWSPESKKTTFQCASDIQECTREIEKIYASINKLNANAAGLQPWVSLDLPLQTWETENVQWMLGTCPATEDQAAMQQDLAKATDMAELVPVSVDKDQQCYLLIVYKEALKQTLEALHAHSFNVVRFKDMTGTPKENLDRIQLEIQQLEEEKKEKENQIVAQAGHKAEIQICLDRVEQEISKQTVAERFLTDGRIFFAEGWIPTEKLNDFQNMLGSFTCAYETEDPKRTETPPTLLKNPKWMRGINMVTEMYSLPAYHNGIDPNPLMFFWYIVFYGFMFADLGYGLIIWIVSAVIAKVYKPKGTMGYMFSLAQWLGACIAIIGFVTGGFFGNLLQVIYSNFMGGAAMPGWMEAFCNGLIINPVNDPMTILIVSLVLGAVHLVMGQCIHIYMGFRDGQGLDALLDVVPWWITFAGIAVIVVMDSAVLLIIGLLSLVLTQGRKKVGLVGKVIGGVGSLYNLTSWLSDILSYSRLMALMLATTVVAQVFNTLGALPHMLIVFILVVLLGNGFNIIINLIGTYVHAARLQYIEYFNKFYIEGGIPFRPLQYNTKYVNIMEEEK